MSTQELVHDAENRELSADVREATAAVRGGLLLIAAKIVHVVAGFGLYFFLLMFFTRTLGEIAGTVAFGVWGTTFSIINPLNMTFAAGTLQLVSRLAASRGAQFEGIFREVRRAQVLLVAACFVVFELSAPLIAARLLNDASYTPYLRLGACIPVFYALRALYQGYLNGVRRFSAQAWLDIGASSFRMLFVLIAAALGFGALGGVVGFVASAVLMWAVAALWIRPQQAAAAAPIGLRQLYGFQAKVMLLTLATYALTSVDLIAVKALAAADPSVADRYAGYYTAAQRLGQVPMSLVVALIYVMFPYVAKGGDDGRAPEISGVIRQGLRTMLLLLVPVTAVLAANSLETLSLVFSSIPRTLAEAGDPPDLASAPFVYLAVAYSAYALLLAGGTLLTAGGRPGVSLWIMLGTLGFCALAARLLTPELGPPGAALSVAVGFSMGFVASAVFLLRFHGACLPWKSAGRILLCGALVYAVGLALPTRGIRLVLEDVCLLGLFGVLILLLRETSLREFLDVGRALLGRSKTR